MSTHPGIQEKMGFVPGMTVTGRSICFTRFQLFFNGPSYPQFVALKANPPV
jgi:hypothetical protein